LLRPLPAPRRWAPLLHLLPRPACSNAASAAAPEGRVLGIGTVGLRSPALR